MPRQQRTHPLVPYAYLDPSFTHSSTIHDSAGTAGPAPASVRKIYIQHLVDILHASLLKHDAIRAKRAWAILVRCREVDWYSRWRWGLAILQADLKAAGAGVSRKGEEVEDWLKTLRLSAVEVEKPAILHAQILHYISTNQHRLALDELDTYLTSYPYILSGPLHTYAGLLSFYLAQPESARASIPHVSTSANSDDILQVDQRDDTREASADDMSDIPSSPAPGHGRAGGDEQPEQPNATMLRQARGWFIKSLEIAPDEVATEFIRLIDGAGTNEKTATASTKRSVRRGSSESAFSSPHGIDRTAERSTAADGGVSDSGSEDHAGADAESDSDGDGNGDDGGDTDAQLSDVSM